MTQSDSHSPGWLSTDDEEIALRRDRAISERFVIEAHVSGNRSFGEYRIRSENRPRVYDVEIRSGHERDNSCSCLDFLHNGLGTCKHIEAVLVQLDVPPGPSPWVEVFLSRRGGTPRVRLAWPAHDQPAAKALLNPLFSSFGDLLGQPVDAIPVLERALREAPADSRTAIRLSRDVRAWGEELRRRRQRGRDRERFLEDVQEGKRVLQPLREELYPYQQEGMLHLAFGERAMLADDMGLGKTVQALAAVELLRSLRGIRRVLIVAPASLKAEWQSQIRRFTDADCQIIQGNPATRERQYRDAPFYSVAHYEQVRSDASTINDGLAPDLVILDEAQRIRNWLTQTARAVKGLLAPYAFVLTGTPLENRIDEVYSIAEFLDPQLFGPLFRFNREFYDLDAAGRPVGFKNLPELHRRVRSIMLRRRRAEVETELPPRTVNQYFVEMDEAQRSASDKAEASLRELITRARGEQPPADIDAQLMKQVNHLRKLCNASSPGAPSPKLDELDSILEDLLEDPDCNVLIFSEWPQVLEETAQRLAAHGIDVESHGGNLERFKTDPACRVALATDTSATGLNLQHANVVINIDIPWSPARLEQRIGRVWRAEQTRPVTMIHLVCSDSIEQRLLQLLPEKQRLADQVLDDAEASDLPAGPRALLAQLDVLIGPTEPDPLALPAEHDSLETLREELVARLGDRLLEITVLAPHLLVAVDSIDEHLRATIDRIPSEGLHLHLISRKSRDLLRELGDTGLIVNGDKTRRLFPERLGTGLRTAWQHSAETLFAAVPQKASLARHLAEGGFQREAGRALCEAIEQALRALLIQRSGAAAEPLPLATVGAQLVEPGLLPDSTLSYVARLREPDLDDIAPMLDPAERLVERIRELLAETGD